jgi:hypothetical protein
MNLLIYVYCYLRKYYKAPNEDVSMASNEALIVLGSLFLFLLVGLIMIFSGIFNITVFFNLLNSYEDNLSRFIVIPLLLALNSLIIYLILKSKKEEIERVQLLIEEGHRYSKNPGWVAFYCWLVFSLVMLTGIFFVTIYQDL